MEHTLQKQMAEMSAKFEAQLAELTALVKNQGKSLSQLEGPTMINNGTVHIGSSHTTNMTQINIHPWDGDDCISVPISLIAAAFTENPRLVEYCQMDDATKANPEIAAPYITEALVDLTKRAHADPMARNIYLNPRRADQALVRLKNGRWEVRVLAEASRSLFDGIAAQVHKAILAVSERSKLPPDVQSTACYLPLLYESEPEEYVKRAKATLSAHLQNTSPTP